MPQSNIASWTDVTLQISWQSELSTFSPSYPNPSVPRCILHLPFGLASILRLSLSFIVLFSSWPCPGYFLSRYESCCFWSSSLKFPWVSSLWVFLQIYVAIRFFREWQWSSPQHRGFWMPSFRCWLDRFWVGLFWLLRAGSHSWCC